MQFFSKRKSKSNWSKINKVKVQQLIDNGKMTKACYESIETVKKNGYWTILDEVEELNNVKKQETNSSLYGTAIGFDTNSRTINPVIFQSGGARNSLYIYPKSNVSVVILTNLVGARPQDFVDEIANLYLTEK